MRFTIDAGASNHVTVTLLVKIWLPLRVFEVLYYRPVGFPPQDPHWVERFSSMSSSIVYLRFGFPPQLLIRVGRFFTNALIFQFFLSVLPGARRLSAPRIFRFSSSVPTGLGGFSLIDLSVFLRNFPLGFGGFSSIPESRFFLFYRDVFSTACQCTIQGLS